MANRHLLHDAARCLRAAALPVLALGMLTSTRVLLLPSPTLPTADGALLPIWQLAIAVVALWLVTSIGWAATGPRRDRRAFQRMQHLRNLATEPNRALVHVARALWSTSAGQHVMVVNIATGFPYRVWLRETEVPVGAFVIL